MSSLAAGETMLNCKRLTNTPVRGVVSVLKWLDDRRKEVVSAQATYASGGSAVGGGVCEQRHAAQRVLPESRFELRYPASSSEEATLEEEKWNSFFGRPVGAGGVGRQEIADAARSKVWAGCGAAGRVPDRSAA